MSRIELTDTTMDVLVKMAEGNPGAIGAMLDIMDKHDAIDPQAALGGLGALMAFDTHGIYGTEIYIIWNDKCDKDVRRVLLLLRAVQLGFMLEATLKTMAADQMRQITLTDEEWTDIDHKVCGELDEFARPENEGEEHENS